MKFKEIMEDVLIEKSKYWSEFGVVLDKTTDSEGIVKVIKNNMSPLATTEVVSVSDLNKLFDKLQKYCIDEIKKFKGKK